MRLFSSSSTTATKSSSKYNINSGNNNNNNNNNKGLISSLFKLQKNENFSNFSKVRSNNKNNKDEMFKYQSNFNRIPKNKIGLYDPSKEKDSCGVALLANMKGIPSHQIVKDANKMLERMHHRGGCGCEPNTGDGAGILVGMPDKFFRKALNRILQSTSSNSGIVKISPEKGQFGCGVVFMSHDSNTQLKCKEIMEKQAPNFGLKVIGWREVPKNSSGLGKSALASEPHMENVFIENAAGHDSSTLERKLFLFRKVCDKEISKNEIPDWYVCSLSARTITYKGQLTSAQLPAYYLDLVDPTFETHMAMVHSRFSTNTFPSWDRAQPCRMLCHNGEINTLRGNKNWMKSRSGIMSSKYFSDSELQKGLLPVNSDEMTDSGNVDAVLELLVRASDRSLVESMMMLIPEAWQNDKFISNEKRAFYEYNSYSMEPWDGPAMMAFTDGRYLGAVLDRNGLRPSRFYVTNDDRVLLSSEVGVLPELPPEKVIMKGRLEPGKIFLVDFEQGGIVRDKEIKDLVASQRPYEKWLNDHSTSIEEWRKSSLSSLKNDTKNIDRGELNRKLHAFGFTTETLDLLLIPMAATGKEALGSMGVDTPLAVLSKLPKQPSDYFKQLFAQVTNPPIDPIREEIVMSLECSIGPEGNLLSIEPKHAQKLVLKDPILSIKDMDLIKSCDSPDKAFKNLWWAKTIDITYDRGTGGAGMKKALDKICNEAILAIENKKAPLIILSHDNVSANKVGIPSLIALGAVHQKLVSNRLRASASIIVDCGDAREVHDFCTLIGFGADAVCPRVSYEAIENILYKDNRLVGIDNVSDAIYNYRKACGKGILKVMSKMGISTLQSYKGAQIFESVGLNEDVVETCFTGTASRISGVGFDTIAKDAEARHSHGFPIALVSSLPFSSSTAEAASRLVKNDVVNQHPHGELHPAPPTLLNPGDYHFRHKGERHLNDPLGMALLQESTKKNSRETYSKYVSVMEQLSKDCSIRGLLELDTSSSPSVPLSEVEPVNAILRRFVTGAMSLGSISSETHETLAVAMNRMNAKSNTGEGGEDPARFIWKGSNGDSKRSAIKQIASGRFGVTSHYLANADQLQIKMAQGAKPGEGGELPGYKVSQEIAKVRGTTPGVGLISPPPHHDIYSIEDLAQLIHDLKNSNPSASVSVKLVSEVGVGIVAAGCAKAKADHIVVSGGDGGTGAAAWTGIHRAGLPWELGLAEAQQTLIMNDLRSRVVLQTDGQLKTGRDVVIASLLGAEEFGFSTAPLIVLGCIMMRKCHLNTCPVGIATQDPVLRAKFEGLPEHVVNYFHLLAEEIREYMAALGFRKMEEMIGRADKLKFSPSSSAITSDNERFEKLKGLNLDSLLFPGSELNPDAIPRHTINQDHELNLVLDNKFISRIRDTLLQPKQQQNNDVTDLPTSISMEFPISNVNRSVGAMLSYQISKKFGANGLNDDSIRIKLRGSGGQSLGFALARGITLELEGDSNDSVGKGLSGGKIIIYPHKEQLNNSFIAEDNVIVGNVALYGATSGEAFFRGRAGERFAVRNSGANSVVEGLGDHGCEYMTGGRVVILGETGRNFAAGMSGGIAFVYDPENKLKDRCNLEMVSLSKVNDPIDQETLLSLIEKHIRYTGSPVAQNIVQNWNESLNSFVQVLPNDYALVLQKQRSLTNEKKSYA